MTQKVIRKLTTILAADAQAFTAAMTEDEVGTYTELQAARSVFFKLIDHHGGRIANTAGDGLIADFPSVVEAVQCAIVVQQELAQCDNRLAFRIGVHLGDVICDGDDLIGEGVNLAARLQSMADPGGVLISQQVYDQVRNKLSIGFDYLGDKRPKNVDEDVPVYRLNLGPNRSASAAPASPQSSRKSAPPRKSKVAQVWDDPDLAASGADPTARKQPDDAQPGSSDLDQDTPAQWWNQIARPASALSDPEKRTRIKMLTFGSAGLVGLNLISGGDFWLAWPLLILALSYGIRHGSQLLGRGSIKGIPLKIWLISAFLLAVNLMSWSGSLWSAWPLTALLGMAYFNHKWRPGQAE